MPNKILKTKSRYATNHFQWSFFFRSNYIIILLALALKHMQNIQNTKHRQKIHKCTHWTNRHWHSRGCSHVMKNALKAQTIEIENYVKCYWSQISKLYLFKLVSDSQFVMCVVLYFMFFSFVHSKHKSNKIGLNLLAVAFMLLWLKLIDRYA